MHRPNALVLKVNTLHKFVTQARWKATNETDGHIQHKMLMQSFRVETDQSPRA